MDFFRIFGEREISLRIKFRPVRCRVSSSHLALFYGHLVHGKLVVQSLLQDPKTYNYCRMGVTTERRRKHSPSVMQGLIMPEHRPHTLEEYAQDHFRLVYSPLEWFRIQTSRLKKPDTESELCRKPNSDPIKRSATGFSKIPKVL